MASSQRLRRGVGSLPSRPGVGVASQRLAPPGVASARPGVAPISSARPGVASQRPSAGVASGSSHDVRAFFLRSAGTAQSQHCQGFKSLPQTAYRAKPVHSTLQRQYALEVPRGDAQGARGVALGTLCAGCAPGVKCRTPAQSL